MVLGDRVEKLQSEISYREYLLWCAYRNKYGPLNPVRRYDLGHALVAAQINNAHGGKAKPVDFMPYHPDYKVDDVKEVGVDEFIAALGSGVKIGR